METTLLTQRIQQFYLSDLLEGFITTRQAANLSPGTIKFYRSKLAKFYTFCSGEAIEKIEQIEPGDIRRFLLALQAGGNNAGGQHAFYRATKAFFTWLESEEIMPPGWRNPMKRVQPPRVAIEPLQPASLADIESMLGVCKAGFTGSRDTAILMSLLDTGARAGELLSANLDDLDPITGTLTIRHGKGGRWRFCYLGSKTRKAVRRYLRQRDDTNPALFTTDDGDRLSYDGLRAILVRLANRAGVGVIMPHAFRRAFAINCLRAGVDIFSLQRLMGHSDLGVLRRYLRQEDADLQRAHAIGSPVDRLLR